MFSIPFMLDAAIKQQSASQHDDTSLKTTLTDCDLELFRFYVLKYIHLVFYLLSLESFLFLTNWQRKFNTSNKIPSIKNFHSILGNVYGIPETVLKNCISHNRGNTTALKRNGDFKEFAEGLLLLNAYQKFGLRQL